MMKDTMRLRLAAFMTLGVTVLAGGCSGGGSSTSAVPSPAKAQTGSSATAKSLLTIHIPKRRATASSRPRVEYVSPGTQGIGVRTGVTGQLGGQSWQLFDVSGTSPLCSTSAGVETCTISVTAPVTTASTTDEFQIDATDQPPAPGDTFSPGNPLSSGDDSAVTITAGANNPVSVILTGVIGNLSVAPAAYSVWTAPGFTTNFNVNVTAADYDTDTIFGTPATFENEIQFADNLATGSPFTYPNPSSTFLGLPPPATAGPILAPIAYTAPTVGAVGAPATVTVSTIIPGYLSLPTNPTATFTIEPLVASVAGAPTANVQGVVVGGPPVTVSVNESGAASFTVTAPPATNGAISLPGVPANGVITATNGTATFSVQGVTATTGSPPANEPTITIVDANGTTATLTVIVSP
jgi:hypothetical protein